MSYKLNINRESIEWEPLVKLINHVRENYNLNSKIDIKSYIRKNYNISLGKFDKVNNYTTVDFKDKNNHLWFILKWK